MPLNGNETHETCLSTPIPLWDLSSPRYDVGCSSLQSQPCQLYSFCPYTEKILAHVLHPPQIAGHGSGIKLLFWVSASNPTEGHFQSPLIIIGHGNLGKEVRSHDELAMSTSSEIHVIAPA